MIFRSTGPRRHGSKDSIKGPMNFRRDTLLAPIKKRNCPKSSNKRQRRLGVLKYERIFAVATSESLETELIPTTTSDETDKSSLPIAAAMVFSVISSMILRAAPPAHPHQIGDPEREPLREPRGPREPSVSGFRRCIPLAGPLEPPIEPPMDPPIEPSRVLKAKRWNRLL